MCKDESMKEDDKGKEHRRRMKDKKKDKKG